MSIAQRYRYLYKPLTFAACIAPFVHDLCGLLPLLGVDVGALAVDLGADPVKRLEHACGKTALNLLLITLAVSPVRDLAHLPDLLRLRRTLGLFAFFYALLHLTVYVVLDLELNLGMVVAEIAKRPYITIGMLALLMLVPLAATSTNRMMRRLGRRWQRLHSLIYPIAILGVWHYWWQVKKDVREPLVYAAILAVLLGHRVVRAWWRRRRRPPASAPATSAAASTAREGR